MKSYDVIKHMIEDGLKFRRPHWDKHTFVFFCPGVPKEEDGHIVKLGDKYSDMYPLEMYITRYPQYYTHGSGGCFSWSSHDSDLHRDDWELCNDWKSLVNECIEERGRYEKWINEDRKRGIPYKGSQKFPNYSHIKNV